MKRLLSFGLMWLVNLSLLWAANYYYPEAFVLGSYQMAAVPGLLVTTFLWTLGVNYVEPLLKRYGYKMNSKSMSMVLVYFAANFVTLWLLSRMAPITGFGVAGAVWLAGLALIANFVQWGNWMLMVKLGLAPKAKN